MGRNFTITTPAETARVGADGRGEMTFTVTNTSGQPSRGMGKIAPLGNTNAEWLSLAPPPEREFAAGAVEPFRVTANVPAGTPPGRYTWRFDVISGAKAGEVHEPGPVVAFEVAASEPPKKKMGWWIWAAVVAAIMVIAVVLLLVFRGPKKVEVPDVTTLTKQEAVKKLTDAKLVPKVVNKTVPKTEKADVVLSQDPVGGKEAEEGSPVTITVSFRRRIPPPHFPVQERPKIKMP